MPKENPIQCPEWRLPIILREVKKGNLMERLVQGQKKQTKERSHELPLGFIEDILDAGTLRIDDWLREQVEEYSEDGKLNESSLCRYLLELGGHTASCPYCKKVYERFQKIDEKISEV